MSTLETRREQMFPKLSPEEIDRLRGFGTVRRYRAGEPLLTTGEISPGMFVIVSGSVSVTRREGLGRSAPIVEEGFRRGGVITAVVGLKRSKVVARVASLRSIPA